MVAIFFIDQENYNFQWNSDTWIFRFIKLISLNILEKLNNFRQTGVFSLDLWRNFIK